MTNQFVTENNTKASEIVRTKLFENGGNAVVYTLRGCPCTLRASSDGVSFTSDKLPVSEVFTYQIFDVVADHLKACGGRAKKGCARNAKLGDPNCDETTVAGAIGYNYFKKENGKSIHDPVFVLAAVLEWAGIVKNENGELSLTEEYMSKL